ncbi:MAG: bifunctional helix-turn-helix domain-containing protein/methylated-DNA--[protein]-cysteine S-methyltransferase [Pseudomonadota bacterium]
MYDHDPDPTAKSYHYHVVRRAIDLIDAHPGLSLEDLATRLSMSPSHLQRIFSAWAGISPKRYQQYLALDHARRLLAERHTVIETAAQTGLSGGGRLHDLFVRWEAMTPGDYARAGDGLTIRQAWLDTPFGDTLVMATDRGICGLGFGSEMGREAAENDLHRRWPKAVYINDRNYLKPFVEPILGRSGETRLHMIGAPFQIKVWEALLAVPSGHVTTYSDIAAAIGKPRAIRAVGTAVGRNPVSWLIPCHRALRKSGGLGGYHWGLPVKRALLAWESAAEEAGAA